MSNSSSDTTAAAAAAVRPAQQQAPAEVILMTYLYIEILIISKLSSSLFHFSVILIPTWR